jgi:A/G-specific adenine glycosylase
MKVAAGKRGRKKVEGRTGAKPEALLAWYDKHARVLLWRVRGPRKQDPYKVWLSEIMLQQTTVKAVAPYYARFLERWPDVAALAAAPLDDVLRAWAGLGYYARARNLHACAKAVCERHDGVFPDDLDELRALPGIGDYTAAAIGAIAYDSPAVPVDGNVERVVARLFVVDEELPAAKPTIKALAASLLPARRAGDFAQAMMDLGATICTPKKPACVLCPWIEACVARKRAEQETFPRKAEKRKGALRRGAVFVALRADGCVLLRTRADKGLLGGMTEVPGSAWSSDYKITGALTDAPKLRGNVQWTKLSGRVRHVFTHFPLEMTVFVAAVPRATPAPKEMRWVKLDVAHAEALPNVIRKVLAHAAIPLHLEERPKGASRRMGRPHGSRRASSKRSSP